MRCQRPPGATRYETNRHPQIRMPVAIGCNVAAKVVHFSRFPERSEGSAYAPPTTRRRPTCKHQLTAKLQEVLNAASFEPGEPSMPFREETPHDQPARRRIGCTGNVWYSSFQAMRKALCSIGVGPHKGLMALTRPTLDAYAQRHGYEVVLRDTTLDNTRPISWSKYCSCRSFFLGMTCSYGSMPTPS